MNYILVKHIVMVKATITLKNLQSKKVLEIDCGAYIIHNCVQTNFSILPNEIKVYSCQKL